MLFRTKNINVYVIEILLWQLYTFLEKLLFSLLYTLDIVYIFSNVTTMGLLRT